MSPSNFRLLLWWCCAMLWLATPAVLAKEAPSPTPTPPPAPYASSEVAGQLEESLALRQEVESDLDPDYLVEFIDKRLNQAREEVRRRKVDTEALLSGTPSLHRLTNAEDSWRRANERLANWNRYLSARIEHLDTLIQPLEATQQRWRLTLTGATENELPDDLVEQVRKLDQWLKETRGKITLQKKAIYRAQNQVIEQIHNIAFIINELRQARESAVSTLFHRETPPLWRMAFAPEETASLAFHKGSPLHQQLVEVVNYTRNHPEGFIFHGVIFILTAVAVYAARRRVRHLEHKEPEMEAAWQIFEMPLATALLLTLLFFPWIHADAPRLFGVAWGAATLIPAAFLLHRLLERSLHPILNALILFYFLDEVREMINLMPNLSRSLFLIEMLAAAGVALGVVATARHNLAKTDERLWRIVGNAARGVFLLFTIAFTANAVGYGRLSLLVGDATLRSLYLMVILYGILRAVNGMLLWLLSFGPLTRLRLITQHRQLLWQRTARLLRWAAILGWAAYTLDRLELLEPLWKWATHAFTATLTIGALHLSLANVTKFLGTIWASFLISRLIRFALEEDVYPRLPLARGLPYAISTLIHYSILLFGFFTATSVLGFDLTQFTILAGAFGVGLGFGLQNIFNNFVSGLILLFERPVKVGDVILFDGVDGVVRQIGIRASVIETRVGSEMIVPNGRLIAERLTNWTYSNRKRGIEIPITLPKGTDPEAVIALLKKVAEANPGVAATPPPEVALLKITPTYDFELRVWTHHEDQWMKIRSDLSIAITKALAEAEIPF